MITFRHLRFEKSVLCRSPIGLEVFMLAWNLRQMNSRIEFMRPVVIVVCPPLMSEGRTPVKVSRINPKSVIFAFIKTHERALWRERKVPVRTSWCNCSCELSPTAVLIVYQSRCTARLIWQLKRAARYREMTRLAMWPTICDTITPFWRRTVQACFDYGYLIVGACS